MMPACRALGNNSRAGRAGELSQEIAVRLETLEVLNTGGGGWGALSSTSAADQQAAVFTKVGRWWDARY